MKYIEKLLPAAGVEWKKLGEVCKIKNGKSYKHLNDGDIPVYGSGGIMKYVDEAAYDSPSVLIPRKGSLKNLFYVETPFWNVDTIFYTEIDVNQILPKYLYYFLATQKLEELNLAGGVPSLTQTILNRLLIPIPPLHVQQEIVRILDKFTELETELETELDLRKQQYERYRDQLLAPDKGFTVWKQIGEIFEIRNGYTPSKANADFWTNGTIPWYRMEDLRANERILEDSIQHITPQAIKGKGLFKAGSIILATSATIGEHALINTDAMANQRFTNFSIRKSLADSLIPKFIYYYFFVIDEWCKQNVNVSSFPSVDIERLKSVLFPIPPLHVQQRIVSLLDKFHTLTTSISEGLPRELELRKQQYAYYRDQLLAFER